jgi:N-acetylmuramic acid 6-phosphate etherase
MDLDTLETAELVARIQKQDYAIADAVSACVPEIAQAVDGIVEKLLCGGRLFYFGAGTSGRLGVLDAAECPPTFGVEPALVQAFIAGGPGAVFVSSEHEEDYEENGARDVSVAGVSRGDAVVGICANGCTPYVLGALKKARAVGALTVLITNNSASDDVACAVITALVGPEALTGSTRMKAGSAQKMILNLISTSVMVKMGRVYENLMVDLRPNSKKLHKRALRIIMTVAGVPEEEAEKALVAANNSSKTAILMLKCGCSLDEAERLLAKQQGFLRKALETLSK